MRMSTVSYLNPVTVHRIDTVLSHSTEPDAGDYLNPESVASGDSGYYDIPDYVTPVTAVTMNTSPGNKSSKEGRTPTSTGEGMWQTFFFF